MKKRVLVSWVGHADIRSMAADQPKSQQQKILDMIRAESVLKDGSGNLGRKKLMSGYVGVVLMIEKMKKE